VIEFVSFFTSKNHNGIPVVLNQASWWSNSAKSRSSAPVPSVSHSKTPWASRVAHPQSGKTSLSLQFVDGHFNEQYFPTIESSLSKNITYKGQNYQTEIVDTAGQVRIFFPAIAIN
jgi:hypothetical protein